MVNIDTIRSNMIDMFNDKNGNIPKQYKSPCKNETIFLTIAEMQQSWADFNDIHTTEPFSKSHLNHSKLLMWIVSKQSNESE